jgi:hypothetical protein
MWFRTLPWTKVEARQVKPPFIPAVVAPEEMEREQKSTKITSESYVEILRNGGNAKGTPWTGKESDLFSTAFVGF